MALGVLATLEPTNKGAAGDASRDASKAASASTPRVASKDASKDASSAASPLPLIPVEYNQLEPLLAAYAGTDTNGASGYSAFPGNTNAIFVSLQEYEAAIRSTGGAVRCLFCPYQFRHPYALESLRRGLF
jgi:hypothetical protein